MKELIEIFYLFSFMALAHELRCLFTPRKMWLSYKEMSGIMATKNNALITHYLIANRIRVIFSALYVVWSFAGIATSDRLYFMALCILCLIIGKLRKLHWIGLLLDASISVLLIVAIIFSHYFS